MRKTNLDTVFLCFSHALTNTRVKVGDFLFSLIKGGFDLFFGEGENEIIDELYIAFEE